MKKEGGKTKLSSEKDGERCVLRRKQFSIEE
jgi:hypothetical protein